MSTAVEELLSTRLPFPGLAAWGGRTSSHALKGQTLVEGLSKAKLEEALKSLTLAAEGLRQYKIHPVQLCWKFEHLRVYYALRKDGACLALFVQNEVQLPSGRIELLLAEYTRLPG